MSSNNNNFSLNTDQDTITIPAKSQTKVNVIFNPSSIGSGTEQQPHQSIISFNNDKVSIPKRETRSDFHAHVLD